MRSLARRRVLRSLLVALLFVAIGVFGRAFEPSVWALDTGTFTLLDPVVCSDIDDTSPLPGGTVVCKGFSVSDCDGTVTLGGHVEIAEETSPGELKGTIVYFKGGTGTAFYLGTSWVNYFRAQGYRTIRVRWNSEWEEGGAPGESLKHAGCRPATVVQWIKTTYGASLPICAAGVSGGASQIAVTLAHYNGEAMLTYAQLETGPPHSRIDEGCNGWVSPLNTPIPTECATNFDLFDNGVPYDYSQPHYFPPSPPPSPNPNAGRCALMDANQGIQDPECCQQDISETALGIFHEGSIMSASGWDNDYSIPVDMYVCSNAVGGAQAGGLWFKSEQAANSQLVIKCYGDGTKTGLPPQGESWCFSESVKTDEAGATDMKDSMLAKCQ